MALQPGLGAADHHAGKGDADHRDHRLEAELFPLEALGLDLARLEPAGGHARDQADADEQRQPQLQHPVSGQHVLHWRASPFVARAYRH